MLLTARARRHTWLSEHISVAVLHCPSPMHASVPPLPDTFALPVRQKDSRVTRDEISLLAPHHLISVVYFGQSLLALLLNFLQFALDM